MIIWGGSGAGKTGSCYKPPADHWCATTLTNAPVGRYGHTAVWTGTEMIIWGADHYDYMQGGAYCAIYQTLHPYLWKKPAVDDSGELNPNGIIEPDETVALQAHLHNESVADAINMTGHIITADPITIINDTAAYGTTTAGNHLPCSMCYTPTAPLANRPALHWDFTVAEEITADGFESATFPYTYHVGESFSDVESSYLFYPFIETILHADVISGCTATDYCPGIAIQRQHMAKFICRAMQNAVMGSCEPESCLYYFADVPPTNAFCSAIEALNSLGIVEGCYYDPTLYCQNYNTLRQEMAKFICKAMNSVVPQSCDDDQCTGIFADVNSGNIFCPYIEGLYKKGVVSGYAPNLYCPLSMVTPGQMAKFPVNAFQLEL